METLIMGHITGCDLNNEFGGSPMVAVAFQDNGMKEEDDE